MVNKSSSLHYLPRRVVDGRVIKEVLFCFFFSLHFDKKLSIEISVIVELGTIEACPSNSMMMMMMMIDCRKLAIATIDSTASSTGGCHHDDHSFWSMLQNRHDTSFILHLFFSGCGVFITWLGLPLPFSPCQAKNEAS
jgi:hypothetical protein